jgi:pSer/pThr/pTyr-binding forkhead associated (FHA) protein
VQLNGSYGELTVSDLGSSNGTSINGVPCLEGEIIFMEPGDVLVLGDARCSLEIRPRGSDKGGTE